MGNLSVLQEAEKNSIRNGYVNIRNGHFICFEDKISMNMRNLKSEPKCNVNNNVSTLVIGCNKGTRPKQDVHKKTQ